MNKSIILSEIRKRKIKNLFKNKKFYYFVNSSNLLELVKTNFILFNKNKSDIKFSLIPDVPQNNHNWIMIYPIRITINGESLYEKYPVLIEKNNKVIYEGKKLDLLNHIVEIDIIQDMSYHVPTDNLFNDYESKIIYLYNKINNLYTFPISYTDKWY
jgi:hypothetical protein